MAAFKRYRRGRREQLPDENVLLGMIYSNTPLPMGAVKILGNYDIKNNGELLVPRRGLRATELALVPKEVAAGTTPVPYNADMALMEGKICVELDNRQYKQIIIGQPLADVIPNTTLYKGYSYIATVYPKGESYEGAEAIPDDLEDGLSSVETHLEPISYQVEDGYCTFTKPDKAEAHGFEITDLDYIAHQIGTFAFNNSYYTFKLKDNNTSKLVYTKLLEKNATGLYTYKTQDITPRVLTPKEAVMWGYNMMASNPYVFANTNTPGSMQFLGLLPYDANNKLLMSPQQNQNLKLKCNYSVTSGKKYTIKWEWKEAAASRRSATS
jgi:hypothetical protein